MCVMSVFVCGGKRTGGITGDEPGHPALLSTVVVFAVILIIYCVICRVDRGRRSKKW